MFEQAKERFEVEKKKLAFTISSKYAEVTSAECLELFDKINVECLKSPSTFKEIQESVLLDHDTWDREHAQATFWHALPDNLQTAWLIGAMELRMAYVRCFAWATPCSEVLARIAEFSKGRVEEHFAGGGYWSRQLHDHYEVKTACYDSLKRHTAWEPYVQWHAVQERDARKGAVDAAATLMLIWPPMGKAGADWELIKDVGPGRRVIFIGEHQGCTGSTKFFEELETNFIEVAVEPIPVWDMLHDRCYFYKRKG